MDGFPFFTWCFSSRLSFRRATPFILSEISGLNFSHYGSTNSSSPLYLMRRVFRRLNGALSFDYLPSRDSMLYLLSHPLLLLSFLTTGLSVFFLQISYYMSGV